MEEQTTTAPKKTTRRKTTSAQTTSTSDTQSVISISVGDSFAKLFNEKSADPKESN